MGTFAEGNIFQKLFGIGFNEFSTEVYKYYYDELYEVYHNQSILADAHNAYFDLLLSTGILGVVTYFGLIIKVLVSGLRMLKTNKNGLYIVMGIAAYLTVVMVNSNLNVITQVFFAMLAVFLNMVLRHSMGEPESYSLNVLDK